MHKTRVGWRFGFALAGLLSGGGCLAGEDDPEVCRGSHQQFDPSPLAGDVTPPSATAVVSIRAEIDDPEAEASCTFGGRFCYGGVVIVQFRATDDHTPAERLGFTVALLEAPPDGFELGPMPIKGSEGRFTYPLPSREFSLEMEVRAVDLNKNIGPPTRFTVVQPAQGAAPPEPLASTLWPMLVALAGVFTGRRRRARR
jgi:hypothetical protein